MTIHFLEDAIGPFGTHESEGKVLSIYAGRVYTRKMGLRPAVVLVKPDHLIEVWSHVEDITRRSFSNWKLDPDYPPYAAAVAAAKML